MVDLVYCGLFSSCFKWVMDRIITPLGKIISDVLGTVLTWLFNNVLAPILKAVFTDVLPLIFDLVYRALADVFYGILAWLLQLLEVLTDIFDLIAGLRDVTFHLESGSRSGSLTMVMLQVPALRTAFLAITLTAALLTFCTAAYSTAKSAFDFDMENRRPVSRVLSSFFRAIMNLLLLNLFVQGILLLAEAILKSMNNVMSAVMGNGQETSIARTIFCTASLKACNNNYAQYNLSAEHPDVTIMGGIRENWYYKTGSSYDYTDIDKVKEFFATEKFDYFVGYIMTFAMILVLGGVLLVFMQRLFDLMTLYIVSPYFVAYIPIDDGEKFGKWREMFLGKAFTGFGTVVAMRIYLMLCPVIMNNQELVLFSNDASPESAYLMDYLMRLLLLLGGAFAMSQASGLVTNLISTAAGSSEAVTAATGQAMAGTALRYGASKAVSSASMLGKGAWAVGKRPMKFAGYGALALGGAIFGRSGGTRVTEQAGEGGDPGQTFKGVHQSFASEMWGKAVGQFGVKQSINKEGKTHYMFNPFGKSQLLSVGKDAKGRFHMGVAGFSGTWGKRGLEKFTTPGLSIKRGKSGDMKLHRLGMFGVAAKFGDAGKGKGVYFKDFNMLGIHRRKGDDGQIHLTGFMGVHREADKDGHYRITSAFGRNVSQTMGNDGKYHFDFGTFHKADDLVGEEGAHFRSPRYEPDLLPGGGGGENPENRAHAALRNNRAEGQGNNDDNAHYNPPIRH